MMIKGICPTLKGPTKRSSRPAQAAALPGPQSGGAGAGDNRCRGSWWSIRPSTNMMIPEYAEFVKVDLATLFDLILSCGAWRAAWPWS